ncbi:MAG: MerR family transcriptional regulator [Chloroflexota bacterium]
MGLFSRLPSEPVYNTLAVVQRTGVPADTFRAWERRYGLPQPNRTDGNQRRYSDRDIATIAWLRDQTSTGLSISQAVDLFRQRDRDTPDELTRNVSEAPAVGDGRLARFVEGIVESLVAFNASQASRVLEDALALLPVEQVCLEILQPVLYEVGRRWDAQEIGISAEHFATSWVIRRLGALYNQAEQVPGRGLILAACPEGELHEAGLLLTSLILTRRGMNILYLGPNLPTDDLITTVQRLKPEMVLLSASTVASAERLALACREIRARFSGGAGPEIGYGGSVFIDAPHLRTGVDGHFLGASADEAADFVESHVARTAPSPR